MSHLDYSSWVSAIGALVSAFFAFMAWRSWRAQFRMSFPYVESDCYRADNALMVDWHVLGQSKDDWQVQSVNIQDSGPVFARFQVRLQPFGGAEHIQDPTAVGASLDNPERQLCILGTENLTSIKLRFRLRSRAHTALKQTRILDLNFDRAPPESSVRPTSGKLFSGDVVIKPL